MYQIKIKDNTKVVYEGKALFGALTVMQVLVQKKISAVLWLDGVAICRTSFVNDNFHVWQYPDASEAFFKALFTPPTDTEYDLVKQTHAILEGVIAASNIFDRVNERHDMFYNLLRLGIFDKETDEETDIFHIYIFATQVVDEVDEEIEDEA